MARSDWSALTGMSIWAFWWWAQLKAARAPLRYHNIMEVLTRRSKAQFLNTGFSLWVENFNTFTADLLSNKNIILLKFPWSQHGCLCIFIIYVSKPHQCTSIRTSWRYFFYGNLVFVTFWEIIRNVNDSCCTQRCTVCSFLIRQALSLFCDAATDV